MLLSLMMNLGMFGQSAQAQIGGGGWWYSSNADGDEEIKRYRRKRERLIEDLDAAYEKVMGVAVQAPKPTGKVSVEGYSFDFDAMVKEIAEIEKNIHLRARALQAMQDQDDEEVLLLNS